MTIIKYDRDEDLEIDVHVGNAIFCLVRVFVYDENGHIIPGEIANTTAMAVFIVDDDVEPEYTIPASVLADNKRLKIVHEYNPGQIGSGTFSALSLFQQKGRKAQPDIVEPRDMPPGRALLHKIKLERR